ncbi:hypothetical protein Dimus_015632 [Dionaea muscipula]
MHVDACKEIYKNLTVVISEKKEIATTQVGGVKIELDGMTPAGILGVPGNNGICEYIKELKRENGVWWLGSGENRRRDDEEAAPTENEEVNPESFDWEAVIDEVEIEREDVNEEAEVKGESGLGEKFFDAEVEVQESAEVSEEVPDVPAPASVQQKEKAPAGVDPSALIGSIPDSVFVSLQAVFEKARADRIQDDLEKAQAENARLLALLQQAQSQTKP